MLLLTSLVVPGAATVKPMANAAVGSPFALATATADGWKQDKGKVIQRAVMRARGTGTASDAAWAAPTVGLPIPSRPTPFNTPGRVSKASIFRNHISITIEHFGMSGRAVSLQALQMS